MKVTFYVEGATLAQQTRITMRKAEIVKFIQDAAGASHGQTITLRPGVDFAEKRK